MSSPSALFVSVPTSVTFFVAQLGAQTTISVGEALTVFAFVTTSVIWISRKLQRIEDDLRHSSGEIERLSKSLESRPCPRNDVCPRG